MNTKKNVLIASVIYITYVVVLLLISGNCHDSWCRIQEDGPFGLILFSFAPLLPIFFFSLLTYRMKEEVFHAWWNFARWWVFVTIGVTLFVQNAGGGGGWGMNGGAFDAFFIGIFYFTFIAGSFSKIIHMYFRLRMGKTVGSEIKIKKFNEIFGWVDRIILVPITLLILLVLYSLSL